MPQLDLMSFFPQYFWCFLLFIFYFLYFSYYIIPKISTSLKFRKQKLSHLANKINKKKEGSSNLLTNYDFIIRKSFCGLVDLFIKLSLIKNKALLMKINQFQLTFFLRVNKIYLNSIFAKAVLGYTIQKINKK